MEADQGTGGQGIEMQRVRWRLVLERPMQCEHAGSMLRGLLGHALKGMGASRQAEGLYAQMFEPRVRQAHAGSRANSVPPPFVLTPPPMCRAPRRVLDFRMTLLGEARSCEPLLTDAWKLVARYGLGPERIPAALDRIDMQGSRDAGQPWREWQQGHRQICLRLTSPFFARLQPFWENTERRAQEGGTQRAASASVPLPATSMDWSLWCQALQRRLRTVRHFYGTELAGEIPESLPAAGAAAGWTQWCVAAHLRDVVYRRTSSRQGHSMPMQGVTGTFALRGDMPEELLSRLYWGQWLHAGGKTALGMGSYVLEPQVPEAECVSATEIRGCSDA